MSHNKRPHHVIDLTGDTPPPKKVSRQSSSSHGRMLPPSWNSSSSQSPSSHRHGPAYPSYVPHASQVVRDEEEEENGNAVIDLTQGEDAGRVPVGMIGKFYFKSIKQLF